MMSAITFLLVFNFWIINVESSCFKDKPTANTSWTWAPSIGGENNIGSLKIQNHFYYLSIDKIVILDFCLLLLGKLMLLTDGINSLLLLFITLSIVSAVTTILLLYFLSPLKENKEQQLSQCWRAI